MALYALDDLGDALAVTREFLTPVERGVWIRLALVALFVGGPGVGSIGSSASGNGAGMGEGVPDVTLDPGLWLVVGAVVLFVLFVGLAVLLIGSIMEFVFVESLRNERVTVRRYWGRRWRQGLGLFGFRLVLGLFVLGSLALLAAPFLVPLLGGGPIGATSFGAFILLLPVVLLVLLVAAVVHSFTTVFVVPIMVLEDTGVLAGWRRLWPTLTAQWRQYVVYAITATVLSALGGLVVALATVILGLLVLVPFLLLFGLGFGLFAFVAEPLGVAVLVVVGILFVLTVIAIVALAQVPVKTYLRYYALLVLGDVESSLDLVPDQRERVREGSSADPE